MAFAEKSSNPPKLLTKHAIDSIRYISMDGRFAYVKKRQGVLGIISYYRSVDFLSDAQGSDFIVHTSKSNVRTLIEIIPNTHTNFNFFKMNKILVAKYGETETKEVGKGMNAQLHLGDEWMSYYDPYLQIINIQNLVTQKKYQIRVSKKPNPFFAPDVFMINPEVVIYSDINEQGISAVLTYNLLTQKGSVIYKASQNGTGLELCHGTGYLAIGEFPYEGVNRGSQILKVKTTKSFNLASYETVYSSLDQDLGNMVCLDQAIYFVKTMNQHGRLGIKNTEAAKLNLKDNTVTVRTSLNYVTQLLEMDGRVMAPYRGDFYVIEGEFNLATDALKTAPNPNEELPFEI
jgi:hypothetical protein